MLDRVRQYIDRHKLLHSGGKYLVTLSGGADSVCLLRMMLTLGYDVEAIHCNFRLRGEESDRDEKFCELLCDKLGVALHRVHFDTREYALLHNVSIEMAARELRYDYFERLRQTIAADGILVAHHRDDNVETILLNMIRGTGIRGLEGIKPLNGHIIRPLLCLSREEILSYLADCHQDYITDSSNLVDDVQRNKLRLNVIPQLKAIIPSASEGIDTTSKHVAEAIHVYDDAISRGIDACVHDNVIDIGQLMQQPSPEALLYEILSRYGVTSGMVQQIYDNLLTSMPGKLWHAEPHIIAKDRDTLIIGRNTPPPPPLIIPECGKYIVDDLVNVNCELCTVNCQPSTAPYHATLDADKVRFPLTIRGVMSGDRFIPYGMKGSKLVSDYLTDRKRNYFQRCRQLVMLDATGTILWLIGERVAAQAAITDHTINVLSVRYTIDESNSLQE